MKVVNIKNSKGETVVPAMLQVQGAPHVIGKESRLIEGGEFSCNIKEKYVYVRKLSVGSNEISISDDAVIVESLLNITSNKPSVKFGNVVYTAHTVTFDAISESELLNCYIKVLYSIAGEEYSKVTVEIPSASTEVTASIPDVKFNLKVPFVWTTDDAGLQDFRTAWRTFNGYPPVTATEWIRGEKSLATALPEDGKTWSDYVPYQYSDGVGGMRRAAFSCAVMYPEDILGTLHQDKFSFEDVLIMQVFGTSMNYHDVYVKSDIGDPTREEDFINRFAYETKLMQERGGIGFKVAIEPSGNKEYIYSANKSKAVCLYIAQVAGSANGVYFGEASKVIADWEKKDDYFSFLYKPNEVLIRRFSPLTMEDFKADLNAANNTILIYGSHGYFSALDEFLQYVQTNRDDVWICSTDELWEWFHLKNHTIIDSCVSDGEKVTLAMYVPNIQYHQFRELTVNINIVDGGSPTVSDNIIGLSYAQNVDKYTLNISLEERWVQNAAKFVSLSKQYPGNGCFRRDAEYLIGLLKDGEVKDSLLSELDS